MGGATSAVDDAEYFFRQASLARLIPEPSPQTQNTDGGKSMELNLNSSSSSSARCQDVGRKIGNNPCSEIENNQSRERRGLLSVGSSHPTRLVTSSGTVITLRPPVNKELTPISIAGIGLKGSDKWERNDPCSDSRPRTEQAPWRSLQLDVPHRTSIEEAAISPEVDCEIVTNIVGGDKSTSIPGTSYQDKGKGIDLSRVSHPKIGNTHLRQLQLGAPRNTAQRKLVRNGRISQNSIAQNKNAKEARVDEAGNMEFVEPIYGTSSHPIHIVSPDSGGSCANEKKEKMIVVDSMVTSNRRANAKIPSNRTCSVPRKEVTVIADIDDDTVRSKDKSWRTIHNPSDKSQKTATGHRSDVNVVQNNTEIIALLHGPKATSVSESGSKREKLSKGKRKYGSTRPSTGECSSSNFDASMSRLQSRSQPSHLQSSSSHESQHHDVIPAIEIVRMQSLEVPREGNSRAFGESSSRAKQVEADEVLARQLQEKYYNESPDIGGTDEMDATIALSLQEEDVRHSVPRQRGESITHVYARPRNFSARPTNRAASARMAELRRNFHRWRMDLEMFDHEEIEPVASNHVRMEISNRALRVQRDFNENDYEMLVALDDNIRCGGASETQINSLPESKIENDNFEEPCVVCLETPIIGETIRHLPCLHKFHKECIDSWLRRRKSCPICKSGIT